MLIFTLLSTAVPRAAKSAASDRAQPAQCQSSYRLERKNATLQRLLVKRMRDKGWGRYMDKGLLAASLVDLSQKRRTYYAGINDDKMMYAASLPKIAILLAVIEAVRKGKLKWTHTFDRRLQNMIRASNNADASWAAELVGLKNIEELMRDPSYCFYDEKNGGLWVGRSYRRGGESNRDPLFGISHGASTRQAARFYTMLDAGKLVTPHWSFRMYGLMSPPAHHHKFVGGLGRVPGVVFLARKSGTWRNFHADSALIQHNGRTYVAVGISELKKGESIMRELIVIMDDLIMDGRHRRGGRKRVRR
ncbi:MAG: serine hydrolase [Myxococcota bacterium]